jgi:hypothetical protein
MSSRLLCAPPILLLAASLSACGGEGGPRAKKADGLLPADAAVAIDPCTEAAEYEFLSMRNGDFLGGQNTDWYINFDGIDGVTVASDGVNPLQPPDSTHPGRVKIPWRCPDQKPADAGATDYAINLQVSGLKPPLDQPPIGLLPDGSVPPKGGWGAMIGCNLYDDPATKGDASGWEGVAFWIRRGDVAPDNEPGSTFVSVPDIHTDANATPTPCNENADAITGSTANQCDAFGTGVALYSEWKFYALPFAEMRQRGYGKHADQAVFLQDGLHHLRGMKMDFAPYQNNWNIWLDGMAFYRKKPATP